MNNKLSWSEEGSKMASSLLYVVVLQNHSIYGPGAGPCASNVIFHAISLTCLYLLIAPWIVKYSPQRIELVWLSPTRPHGGRGVPCIHHPPKKNQEKRQILIKKIVQNMPKIFGCLAHRSILVSGYIWLRTFVQHFGHCRQSICII